MALGSSQSRSWKSTAIWLALFFVLALTLRVAFSAEASFDEENERYLHSGNDPWFHDRTVEYITETGESLTFDPLINYPHGGKNPNPPIYDWTTAVDAGLLDMAGAVDPVSLALNLAVAFWGALTLFPVYVIGKELWGRKVGLWAAFFMAVSAPHIQRSVWGFADHDAATMFFIATAFAFLLKALKAIKHQEYVRTWKTGVGAELGQAMRHNKEALLWATLSGIALAATALTWKGYPYALAIMAVAFGFQLLSDHARNKDSTVTAAVYLIPVLLTLLVPWWYYASVGFVSNTLMANLYVLIGMLVAGVLLVPTRELPSILVFPAILVAAGLGMVAMLLVFPDVGRTIFTGLGYFQQSKLYTTIAEAQRTELGSVAAAFGFFTFVLAFWPFARAIKRAWKGDHTMMLMASWATVAIFMAFAASRFIMNASPVFVVFMGAGTVWILEKAGLGTVARRRRAQHGQNPVASFFRSLTWRSTMVVLFVALVLVLPNIWVGADAGTSSEFDRKHGLVDDDRSTTDRFGAYGVGYSLHSNGWLEIFDHLATLDTDQEPADRPGFMAWWDYGHWAVSLGDHPTVADPFQNHFEFSGRFLAAESEAAGAHWLSALLLDKAYRSDEGRAQVEPVLTAHDVDAEAFGRSRDLDARFEVLQDADDAFALYEDVADATGDFVKYFGVDSRMYPTSQTQTGIFYAPVFLANKNPDDFLIITYQGQGLQLRLEQYGVDENGDSFLLPEPRFVDPNGREWVVAGGQAFPKDGFIPGAASQQQGVQVQSDFRLSQRFHDTMYTKAYGGPSAAQQPAGNGLSHWRVIEESTAGSAANPFRLTALLEYYSGHTVTGQVLDESDSPMQGVAVTFVDGFGASHHAVATDADGGFEVLAPFGDDLQLSLQTSDGTLVYQEPWRLSREEADGGRTDGVVLTVEFADLAGRVYRDLDGDGAYSSEADQTIAGATVSTDGRTVVSAADGTYMIADLQAGGYEVTVTADGYANTTFDAALPAGATTEEDVAMTATPSEVTVTFQDGGEGVAGIPIQFDGPESREVTTGVGGQVMVPLQPGDYTVTVDHAFTDSEGQEVTYEETVQVTVAFGGDPMSFTIDAS